MKLSLVAVQLLSSAFLAVTSSDVQSSEWLAQLGPATDSRNLHTGVKRGATYYTSLHNLRKNLEAQVWGDFTHWCQA